jgi:hypothetical protein
MPHVLVDVKFLEGLLARDEVLAQRVRALGCPHCGGRLHQAHYPRKVRGIAAEAEALFEVRFSYCCERCRRRQTPSSVRFLGRRVYAAIAVLVAGMLMVSASLQAVARQIGAACRTLGRWRRWWQSELLTTDFWKAEAGGLREPPVAERMPVSLVAQFRTDEATELWPKVLKWLRPLSGVGRGFR